MIHTSACQEGKWFPAQSILGCVCLNHMRHVLKQNWQKARKMVERASAIFAFSILFSTCKAPVPQLRALSINCCPPSFRCTGNRVVSFNLTRPPTLTRFHIKEALILSASQLSSTKKNEQEIKNISLSLFHMFNSGYGCQTSATVADCQAYGP